MGKIDDLIKNKCPNGVKFLDLEKCCNILDNKRKPVTKSARKAGEYPYYGANGIQDYVADYIFDGKYVLVGEDGSVINENGNPIVTWAEGKIWVNNHAHIIEEIEGVSLRYLYHYIQTINVTSLIHGNIPKLNQGDFRKLQIAVPPLEVQHEIVHILDDFTLLSAELSAELKARQKQYEYYLHKLLAVKDGMEMTIGDIYDFKYGTGNTIPTGGGEYPVYGSNGLVGYYSEYNSEDAPVIGHIGAYAGIVNWASGKHFVTYNGVICKHKNKKVNKKYAYYILLTQDFIGEQKGAQPFVSYDALKKPKVKIPSIEEQERIVKTLDKFDKLCNDISKGLPAEIEARQKQYEYYRDKLLTFKELVNEG